LRRRSKKQFFVSCRVERCFDGGNSSSKNEEDGSESKMRALTCNRSTNSADERSLKEQCSATGWGGILAPFATFQTFWAFILGKTVTFGANSHDF